MTCEEVRMKFKKVWIGCVISIVLFPITMVFSSDTGCIANNTPYTIQLYNWQIVHQDNPDAGIVYFIDFYVNGYNYAQTGAFTISMGPQQTRCFQIHTGGGKGQGIQGDVYVFPQTIPGAGVMPVTITKNYKLGNIYLYNPVMGYFDMDRSTTSNCVGRQTYMNRNGNTIHINCIDSKFPCMGSCPIPNPRGGKVGGMPHVN